MSSPPKALRATKVSVTKPVKKRSKSSSGLVRARSRRGLMARCSSWLAKRVEATATSPEPRPVKVSSNLLRRSPPVPPRGRLVPWSSVPSVYRHYFLGTHHFNLAAVDPLLGPVVLSIKFDLEATSNLVLLRLPYGAFMLEVMGAPPKSSLTLARLVCPALAITTFTPLLNPSTSLLLANNYRGTATLYRKLTDESICEEDTLPRPCCVPTISTPSKRSRKLSTTSTEFSFSCFNASNEELDQGEDEENYDVPDNQAVSLLEPYPSVSQLGDCSTATSSGRLTEGDWGSDYQLLLSHPPSPSESTTPFSTLSSTISSSSPHLQPVQKSEHCNQNLISMMAKLSTEEDFNHWAALTKELQYLEEEVGALRSATSKLNAEAEIIRIRLGEPSRQTTEG